LYVAAILAQPRTSHTPCGEAGKSSSEELRLSGG
jgi:hypothetical protein